MVHGASTNLITDYFNDARQPVWSPDGKILRFFSYREGNYDLYTIEPDGSNMRSQLGMLRSAAKLLPAYWLRLKAFGCSTWSHRHQPEARYQH